jgi:hypothetical protein
MSLDFTDLHTLIVRAHARHRIPIGKAMRATLQAAANHRFPLYRNNGLRLKLSAVDRDWLRSYAAIAEQQTEVRWWTKGAWTALRAVLVPETNFWEWFNTELGPQKTSVTVPAPAKNIEFGSPETTIVGPVSEKRTARRRDKRARARRAIEALWPDRIPDQSILANVILCKAVAEWLKEDSARQKVPHVPIGDDTILRAAGRR